jgi:hypothetical protein
MLQQATVQGQMVQAALQSICISVIRDTLIGRLFPCGPGTFSSYATNTSRLGYCIYTNNNVQHIQRICTALINGDIADISQARFTDTRNIISLFPLGDRSIDTKLAITLFILDICDKSDHILSILDEYIAKGGALTGYVRNTIEGQINQQYNGYNHRPTSASSISGTGDCVQTLYRHLINIAIQNDAGNEGNYNINRLPVNLHGPYTKIHGQIQNNVITIDPKTGESGRMDTMLHKDWADSLGKTVIEDGKIDFIAAILTIVEGMAANRPALAARTTAFPHHLALSGAADSADNKAIAIKNALNELDGKGNDTAGHSRFLVGIINQQHPTLVWATVRIEIVDNLWGRRITIGTSNQVGSHAEIIEIRNN